MLEHCAGEGQLFLASNPAASVVHLYRNSNDAFSDVHVALFDAAGRMYWQGTMGAEHRVVSLENLPAGVYFLRVMEGGEVVTLRGGEAVTWLTAGRIEENSKQERIDSFNRLADMDYLEKSKAECTALLSKIFLPPDALISKLAPDDIERKIRPRSRQAQPWLSKA